MPKVLTTDSVINCPHHGKLLFPGAIHKLTVQGKSVLLKDDIKSATVQRCLNPISSSPPQSQTCLTVLSVTVGESSKLTVGGVAVMLETMAGYTNGFPPPPPPPPPPPTGGNMKVVEVQSKLKAV